MMKLSEDVLACVRKDVKVSRVRKPSKHAAIGEPNVPDAFRRGAISVFLLFHLVAITCWALPANFWMTNAVRELVRPYMQWSGLFQSWDTFAPNPPTANSFVRALVVMQDRHLHVWAFPRMEELSFSESYRKERYRKFVEVLQLPSNAALWPDVAKHIARLFNSPAGAPDKVILVQYQSEIPSGNAREPTPKPNAFYEQYIQPEDLK
jgi:hypothetical protein